MLLGESEESSCKVILIGTMQRLGISYHFEEEIRSILSSISMGTANDRRVDDVASMALKFRLLRENKKLRRPVEAVRGGSRVLNSGPTRERRWSTAGPTRSERRCSTGGRAAGAGAGGARKSTARVARTLH